MWSWNPKPWMHTIDYAVMFGGILSINAIPANIRTDYNGLVFLFVGGLITTGMASYVFSDAVMTSNKIKENKRNIRMYEQPTEEEKNGTIHLIRNVVRDTVVTGGNVQMAVDKAPEAVRKVPAGFVAHQNTAEVLRLAEVDNAIRKICRRNVTLIEHPDLGFPDGDFREDTWVDTKEMTRKTLQLSMMILERHGGVERERTAKNSRWVPKDLSVLKHAARTPLLHPIECYCADCAQKRAENQ